MGTSSQPWAIRRAGRIDSATGELFELLAADGIDALLLRGPAIARRLYDEGERGYGDCDVLVPTERRESVEEVLRRLGYEPYTALGLARHWERSADRAQVDLHESIWGVRAPARALWLALGRDRETLEVGDRSVPVPCPAAVAVVVALHASQHGATVTHPLEDLRRALDRFDAGVWADAAARAGAAGCLRAFRQGLSMLPAGARRLESLGLEPRLSRQARARLEGRRVPDYLFEELSLRERAAFIRRRFGPSRSRQVVWTPGVHARAAAGSDGAEPDA